MGNNSKFFGGRISSGEAYEVEKNIKFLEKNFMWGRISSLEEYQVGTNNKRGRISSPGRISNGKENQVLEEY